MVTADLSRDPDPEKQAALVRVDVYDEWRQREGAPLVGGIYLRDMNEVEVGPWPRKGDGVNGAYLFQINVEGVPLAFADPDDTRDPNPDVEANPACMPMMMME